MPNLTLCFIRQAELITMNPLAACSEALALEQSDLLAELLDLEVAFLKHGISIDHKRLQAVDVVWKCRTLDHDDKLT